MGRKASVGLRRFAQAAVLAAMAITTTTTTADAASGTLIKSNCAPAAAASDGTMVWHERTAAGVDDTFIGDGNCVGKPLIATPYDGHRGPADMTRDGRFVILVTAVGWDRKTTGAEPGKGSQNAIQVFDRQTGKVSTLLPGATKTQRGVIWPKLNANGTKMAWAQMVRTPFETGDIWGDWELHVADVDLATGTLTNNRAWHDTAAGKHMIEAYGWIPGTNKVIFQSTTRPTSTGMRASQLFTLPDTFTASTAPTRISPKMAPSWSWQQATDVFHEFAHFAPGDPNTLYTSVGANTMGGNDLFKYDMRTQSADGTLGQSTRISYFGGDLNKNWGSAAIAGWPTPAYKVVVAMAWVNGGWVAGVCPDIYCTKTDAWRINLQ
jgi:hypothetical protein